MGWWCQIPKQEYPYPPSPDRILGEYVVPDTFPDRWVVVWWWWCSHVREQCLYFLPDPVDRWLVGQVSITEKIWPPNSFLFKSSSHPWPGGNNFFITTKYTFSFSVAKATLESQMSVCRLLQKPLSLSESLLSTIEPIGHYIYRLSDLLSRLLSHFGLFSWSQLFMLEVIPPTPY